MNQAVINDQSKSINWRRDELLSLFSVSGTLAGLCITVVAMMNTLNKAQASVSIVDDMFGICAAAFLICIYLIFWALRSKVSTTFELLVKTIEGIFLLALTTMTTAAFFLIYTLW